MRIWRENGFLSQIYYFARKQKNELMGFLSHAVTQFSNLAKFVKWIPLFEMRAEFSNKHVKFTWIFHC